MPRQSVSRRARCGPGPYAAGSPTFSRFFNFAAARGTLAVPNQKSSRPERTRVAHEAATFAADVRLSAAGDRVGGGLRRDGGGSLCDADAWLVAGGVRRGLAGVVAVVARPARRGRGAAAGGRPSGLRRRLAPRSLGAVRGQSRGTAGRGGCRAGRARSASGRPAAAARPATARRHAHVGHARAHADGSRRAGRSRWRRLAAPGWRRHADCRRTTAGRFAG